MIKNFKFLFFGIASIRIFLSTPFLEAENFIWVGDPNGEWTTPANWNLGTVPNSNLATVTFNLTKPPGTVSIASAVSISSLTVFGPPTSITGPGTLEFETNESSIILSSNATGNLTFISPIEIKGTSSILINNLSSTFDIFFTESVSSTSKSPILEFSEGRTVFTNTGNPFNGLVGIAGGTLRFDTAGIKVLDATTVGIASGTLDFVDGSGVADSPVEIEGGAIELNGGTATMKSLAVGPITSMFTDRSNLSVGATPTISSGQINLTALSGETALKFTTSLGSPIPTVFAFSGDFICSSTNTFAGNLILENTGSSQTFTIDSGNVTVSSIISGTNVALFKIGAGTLTFSGTSANTYGGAGFGTTVSGGTLILNKTAGVNAVPGDVTLSNGGRLQFNASNQIPNTADIIMSSSSVTLNNFDETISALTMNGGSVSTGTGTLSLASTVANVLILNDAAQISGNLALIGGAGGGVNYNGTNSASSIENISLGSVTRTFTVASPGMSSIGVISGAGGLTKLGPGTLTFSGSNANTYLGLTSVAEGTLFLNKSGATELLGADAIAGDILIVGGTLFLESGNQISDTSVVTLSLGTFNLNGNAETIGGFTFISGTFLQGGATLSLTSTGTALTLSSAAILDPIALTGLFGGGVVSSGTASLDSLNLGSAIRPFTVGGGSNLTVGGIISGSGGITTAGAGTLTFSGTGANTYTGTTTVATGTLALNKVAAAATAGNVTLAGGTVSMTTPQSIESLTFSSGTLSQAGATLSLSSTGTALTMTGTSIAGPITLTGTSGGGVVYSGAPSLIDLDLGSAIRTFDAALASNLTISGVISGSGGIAKTGAGILTFSGAGANAYTGVTTVSTGTLALSKIAALATAGNVTLAGGTVSMTTPQNIESLTYQSGTLSQGGATLSLISTGTALTMRNVTITDPISITGASGGGVVFDATNNGTAVLGALSMGSVNRNFTIGDGTATVDMNISGVLSGSDGLTLSGPGILAFTGGGANTYSGTTTVNGGTLRLDKTAATAIPGNINMTAGNVDLQAAAQIADTSNVTMSGGVLRLNGNAESFTSLVLNGGAVNLGGATLSLISTGTALTMRNTTLNGTISLTGASGGGVVFDATNGGTATITSIDLGSAGVDRIFTIGNGSAQNDMSIHAGISAAGGGFLKEGAGRLQLIGTHTYPGAANSVTAGSLAVDGALTTGSLTIGSVGLLVGNGSIIGAVRVDGRMNPGSSIGTITLIGAQTFGSGSTVEIEIAANSFDLIDIVGTLTIEPNATLDVIPFSTELPFTSTFPIIQTTAGITGSFTTSDVRLPLLTATLTQTPTQILLSITNEFFADHVGPGRCQKNARHVATYLDTFDPQPGTDLYNVLQIIRLKALTDSDVEKTLDQLQSSFYKGFVTAQETNSFNMDNIFNQRSSMFIQNRCFNSQKSYVWIDGFYDHISQGTESCDVGFHSNTGGAVLGLEFRFTDEVLFGFGSGYSYSDVNWDDDQADGSIQSGYGAFYGTWYPAPVFINLEVLGSYNSYEGTRRIKFFTLERHARNSHHGTQFLSQAQLGTVVNYLGVNFTPSIAVKYLKSFESGYLEHGANSINLKVDNENYQMLRTEAGCKLSKCKKGKSVNLLFNTEIFYIRESRFSTDRYREKFVGAGPQRFKVTGPYPSRNLIAPGFSISGVGNDSGVGFTLEYKGEFSESFQNHLANFQLDFPF